MSLDHSRGGYVFIYPSPNLEAVTQVEHVVGFPDEWDLSFFEGSELFLLDIFQDETVDLWFESVPVQIVKWGAIVGSQLLVLIDE